MGGVLSLSGRALAFSIALFYGWRRFGSANAITALVALVGGIGTILVLLAGGGLRAVAAWQAGVTSLIAAGALAAVLRTRPASRHRARPSWRTLRPQVRFGIASQVLTLSVNLLWVVAPSLVGAMLGARLVASYDVGRKFPFALSALNWRSSESFFPAASRESRVGDLQRRRGLLEAVTRWNLVLALPLSIVLFLLAPNLLSVWLDSVPPHATAVLRLLAAVVAADAFGLGAVHVLWAAGRMRSLLGILSATTLAGLGIALILLWQIGIVGVAIALLLTTVIRSTLVLRAASRDHDFPLVHLLANAARGLTTPLGVSALVTFALRELIQPGGWIGLVSVGLAGIVAYLAAASLASSREEEREILSSMLHVPLLAVGIVSHRLRGLLRRIGPLRSTSYLLRELARMAGSRARPTAAMFDSVFAEKADPWDYGHSSEQKRHLTAARMLDALRADRCLGRTLEIGCAEGMFTELLIPRCEEVLAVDISPVALERARLRCTPSTNLAFAQWDLLDAFELGSFDLVVAMDVLDYFIRPTDFGRARMRILGLLDDGGHLLVSTKNQSEVFEKAWWRRWIQRGRMINESLASLDGLSLVESDSTTTHTLSLYVRARG
jgi:O-antigen/teichoic acid export membrane protein/2-polyprenyl-3-methyl-5-hydroxy-6-metoxy-1,4-benzoquinol methylase